MALDLAELQKPLGKLRKSIKKLSRQPSPEQVHDLRTRARRMEATLHALALDRRNLGQRVCKAVAPIRKRAGKVRDMDVLTGFASTLSDTADSGCLVQLLEHLGHWRFRAVRKLRAAVSRERREVISSLKRCSSFLNRGLEDDKRRAEWEVEAAADVLKLSREMARWPKLTAGNLHPFRLKTKQLRYVLELSAASSELIDKLGTVKDAIGEWHDWNELAVIAEEVLRHGGRCEVRQQIRSRVTRHLQNALNLANQLRQRYFSESGAESSRIVEISRQKGARSGPGGKLIA